jgi:uncharacterized RDD family membrane protein YckC
VVRAAGAAAEAARNAQAAAQAVLAGLESGPIASGMWEPEVRPEAHALLMETEPPAAAPPRWQDEPPVVQPSAHATIKENSYAGAQPRWEEALPVSSQSPGRDVWAEMRLHPQTESKRDSRPSEQNFYMQSYRHGLDAGELFPEDSYDSYDPMGSATVQPVQHLPANLIEFPRELVATRKARPRLAEGPFYDASHANSQLSIFEVDPDLLPTPVVERDMAIGEVAPPEWASIELDHAPEPHPAMHAQDERRYAEQAYAIHPEVHAQVRGGYAAFATAVEEMPHEAVATVAAERERLSRSVAASEAAPAVELMVANFSDRMLATVVDGALVTLAFLAAAVVVTASTSHPPTGRIALIASGCGLVLFWILYQFLFLSYAEEGTPGMRYARIALCTFDDDNPSREQMRNRIPAMLLSALPAGLGLVWALFDGDHLGWHDRMTRTYQRKY